MREMTTAEFAKANLAALEEPVKIRRYTKAVGTYYPEGYIASLPGADPLLLGVVDVAVAAAEPVMLTAAREKIEDLEEEVKRLKKELAARPPVGSELLAQERRTVPQHPMKDAFSNLAKQDREFFERKLGKPGKTK
jgi:hypothetical protein